MDILSQLNKICDQDAYLELKLQSKVPVVPDWPNRGQAVDAVLSKNNNLGIVLGASSGLLDVDLDCREAKALADIILPMPHAIFDRGSDASGHYLYRASSFGLRKAFNAEGSKSTLVELRGDRAQTMIPPSIHPNGSKLVFTTCNPNAAEVTKED